MERIDFLGSPACGKSTLYRKLFKFRSRSDSWISPHKALCTAAINYSCQNMQSCTSFLFKVILSCGLFHKLHPSVAGRILSPYRFNVVWNRMKSYQDFFRIALEGAFLIDDIQPFFRIMRMTWFYEIASEVMFLESIESEKVVLYDESLSHRVYDALLSRRDLYKRLVEGYFQYIPKPKAIVYCSLDIAEIFSRLKSKRELPHVYIGLDDDQIMDSIKLQIAIAEIAAGILNQRGVNIFHVDMSIDNRDNAHFLARELRAFLVDR